jgi:hypothetical protein
MNAQARHKSFNWHRFLKKWSQDFINNYENSSQLPAEVLDSGWLGFSGATEEQIHRVEARLQTSLPPSYRAFLKVSNGWRQTTPFIYRIWSVEEIEWFSIRHASWIKSFTEAHLNSRNRHTSDNHRLNGSLHISFVPESEYFLYGDQQDCSKIRLEYLNSALEVSAKGESAIYLLNPQIVSDEGEWEAWFFGDWLPGADRYRSFQALMEAEYKNFLEMKDGS